MTGINDSSKIQGKPQEGGANGSRAKGPGLFTRRVPLVREPIQYASGFCGLFIDPPETVRIPVGKKQVLQIE